MGESAKTSLQKVIPILRFCNLAGPGYCHYAANQFVCASSTPSMDFSINLTSFGTAGVLRHAVPDVREVKGPGQKQVSV